ncbi:Membrane-anchored glycerophosphoryl diester phosphodiesterase (GDPDase) OS=Streptomyces violarus OX=67380 GN=FHS41_004042 PE=4 SV=1 [Streptomyces violarus]
MNDTPGWASPGSAPSDGQKPDASGPAEPAATPTLPNLPTAPAPHSPRTSRASLARPRRPPARSGPRTSRHPPSGPPPAAPAPRPAPARLPRPRRPARAGALSPPAARPAAPVDTVPAVQEAPGGPGGWGSAWGGPPPAAKPGVIPLRPLGVGEILDGAVSTMRTYWRTVLGISLTVAVVTEIIVVLFQGFVLGDSDTDVLDDPSATLGELSRAWATPCSAPPSCRIP